MSDSGYLMQTALPYGLHGLNDASFVQYTHALLVSVRSPLFLPVYAIVPVLGAEAATLWHVRVLVCSGRARALSRGHRAGASGQHRRPPAFVPHTERLE